MLFGITLRDGIDNEAQGLPDNGTFIAPVDSMPPVISESRMTSLCPRFLLTLLFIGGYAFNVFDQQCRSQSIIYSTDLAG